MAELQGLDGAYSFSERLLQRIWQAGDFDRSRARTADGRSLRILFAGRWNGLGGPDFLNARIELDGRRLVGDVELHLRASDWLAHGHDDDPNYRNVVLHVVLFPPAAVRSPAGDGRELPLLVLLPLLHRSLEEHAEDAALERMASPWLAIASERLLALESVERRRVLQSCAAERWRTKVRLASRRIDRSGWNAACHQLALEILGYRLNRGPMLVLAAEHPLEEWLDVGAETGRSDRWFEEHRSRWNLQAVRPANHPRRRLRQYQAWVSAAGCWPERLLQAGGSFPEGGEELVPEQVGALRRRDDYRRLAQRLELEVTARTVGGTRLSTLICDGFLPLMGAARPAWGAAGFAFWFAWPAGDIPERVRRWAVELGLAGGRDFPFCQGLAQGLLGWIWREEEREQQSTACRCWRGT